MQAALPATALHLLNATPTHSSLWDKGGSPRKMHITPDNDCPSRHAGTINR